MDKRHTRLIIKILPMIGLFSVVRLLMLEYAHTNTHMKAFGVVQTEFDCLWQQVLWPIFVGVSLFFMLVFSYQSIRACGTLSVIFSAAIYFVFIFAFYFIESAFYSLLA